MSVRDKKRQIIIIIIIIIIIPHLFCHLSKYMVFLEDAIIITSVIRELYSRWASSPLHGEHSNLNCDTSIIIMLLGGERYIAVKQLAQFHNLSKKHSDPHQDSKPVGPSQPTVVLVQWTKSWTEHMSRINHEGKVISQSIGTLCTVRSPCPNREGDICEITNPEWFILT